MEGGALVRPFATARPHGHPQVGQLSYGHFRGGL